ncbi:MAG: cytochrome P450 [Caldilineaceae bacterium]
MSQPFNSIPGPHALPLVGSLGPLSGDALVTLPALAEEYGPIVRFGILGRQFVLLADPELIRGVLVEKADLFPKAQRDVEILGRFLGKGLVTNNGASHRKQRKLAQPAFHHRRIQAYAETMVDYAAAQVDGWHDGAVYDIGEEMRRLTMYIVAKTLFDVDHDEIEAFAAGVGVSIHNLQQISDERFDELFSLPDWLPTARNRLDRRSRETLNAAVDQIIALRRAQSVDGEVPDRGDLLSMLMLARDEDGRPMDDQQLRDEVVTLFVAGHETTSSALTWTWLLLAQHPEVAARLHAELDAVLGPEPGRLPTLADLPQLPYTLQVIKESMRLYPPVWVLNTRTASEDTTIGDYEIPKGTNIFISQYVMHRQARFFPEPQRFDPARWTPEFEASLPKFAYMPFGGGPRVCIGNSFAMMEAQLLLATIAKRWDLALLPGQSPAPSALITLGPKTPIQMRAHRRTPIREAELAGELASSPVLA